MVGRAKRSALNAHVTRERAGLVGQRQAEPHKEGDRNVIVVRYDQVATTPPTVPQQCSTAGRTRGAEHSASWPAAAGRSAEEAVWYTRAAESRAHAGDEARTRAASARKEQSS